MKPLTRQQAINAKCKDCSYDPKSGRGTWKEQIAQCTISACPLWPHRPSPKGGVWEKPPRDPENIPQKWLDMVGRSDVLAMRRSGI